ncbi:1982_t:CDS:2, partial [Racocetra fulgida]
TLRTNNKTIKQSELVGDPNIEQPTIKLIFFQEISKYIIVAINDLEYNAELSHSFCIQLDENTLNNIETDVKIMAKLIIDEIEEGDSYNWTIENAYFTCFQSYELMCKYKDSSYERIVRYNCNSKISIKIDIPAKKAKVVLNYKFLHEKPTDIETPDEIKQEISKNLYLNPMELQKYLHKKAIEEFNFINSSFIPDQRRKDKEYYIVCLSAFHKTVIEM